MTTVSRNDRLWDLATLALVVLGAVLIWISITQLRSISTLSYKHPGPRSESALRAADHARYLAYAGAATIVAGCVVGAIGAVRITRRPNMPVS